MYEIPHTLFPTQARRKNTPHNIRVKESMPVRPDPDDGDAAGAALPNGGGGRLPAGGVAPAREADAGAAPVDGSASGAAGAVASDAAGDGVGVEPPDKMSGAAKIEPSGHHRVGGAWWRWGLAALALAAIVAALAPSAADAMRSLPGQFRHLHWAWLPLALLCQGALYVCLAGILAAALGALGLRRVSFPWLVPTSAVFLLTNRALPGPAVAGAAVLVARLRQRGVPPEAGQAVAATFFGADYAGFLLLGAVALPFLAAEGRLGPLHPALLLAALGLIVLAGAGSAAAYHLPDLLERIAETSARAAARVARRGPDADHAALLARAAVTASRARIADLGRRPGALLAACLWSFLMHAVDALTLVITVRAFGAPVAFAVAAAGYVAGNMGAIVSFLPGGVGLYEGGMIAALHAVGGVPTATAIAATLVYRLFSLWLPLPFAADGVRRLTARRGAAAGPGAVPE